MIIEKSKNVIKIRLSWSDIKSLKEGNLVAERYNGEHKFNLSCTQESLLQENWIETETFPVKMSFNEYLHDFFVELPIFYIRNALIPSMTILLCRNPYFKEAKIICPT